MTRLESCPTRALPLVTSDPGEAHLLPPRRMLRGAEGREGQADLDVPLAGFVGGDVPVGHDRGRLVDPLEASFALAHGLDRIAPDAPRPRPREADGEIEPLVG